MRVFRHYDALPSTLRGGAVALGNFDGLHRGHQALIEETCRKARAAGTSASILTFEPHPRQLFRPKDPPFRLSSLRTKLHLLEEAGLDAAVVLHFDWDLAKMPAERFIDEVVAGGLNPRDVIVGGDFRFGHRRMGDVAMLQARGRDHGFTVKEFPPVRDENGDIISSSRVRDALRAGKPPQASALLGRDWEMEGRIVHGDKRGRELGYPTANLRVSNFLRPAYGVYAVRAGIDYGSDTVWLHGVANYGIRPMYEVPEPLLEVFLFDFDEDIYGRHLRVQMVSFLRGEMKFDGIEALIAQMDQDSASARTILAAA